MSTTAEYTNQFTTKYGRAPTTAEGAAILQRAFYDANGRAPADNEQAAIRQRAHVQFAAPPQPTASGASDLMADYGQTAKTLQAPRSVAPQHPGVYDAGAMSLTSTPSATAAPSPGGAIRYNTSANPMKAVGPPTVRPFKGPQPVPGAGVTDVPGHYTHALPNAGVELGGMASDAAKSAKWYLASKMLENQYGPLPAPGTPEGKIYQQAHLDVTDPDLNAAAERTAPLAALAVGLPILGGAGGALPGVARAVEMGLGAQGGVNTYKRLTGQAPSFSEQPVSTLFDLGMVGAGLHGAAGALGDFSRERAVRGAATPEGVPDVTATPLKRTGITPAAEPPRFAPPREPVTEPLKTVGRGQNPRVYSAVKLKDGTIVRGPGERGHIGIYQDNPGIGDHDAVAHGWLDAQGNWIGESESSRLKNQAGVPLGFGPDYVNTLDLPKTTGPRTRATAVTPQVEAPAGTQASTSLKDILDARDGKPLPHEQAYSEAKAAGLVKTPNQYTALVKQGMADGSLDAYNGTSGRTLRNQSLGGDTGTSYIVRKAVEPVPPSTATPDIPGTQAHDISRQAAWDALVGEPPVGGTPAQVEAPVKPKAARGKKTVGPVVEVPPAGTSSVVSDVPATETPEAAPVAAKEPWQMTQMDFYGNDPKLLESVEAGKSDPSPTGNASLKEKRAWMERDQARFNASKDANARHRAIVADAVKQGKPVPPEVLADYPDLAPKPPEAAPTQAQKPTGEPGGSVAGPPDVAAAGQKEPWQMTPDEYAHAPGSLDTVYGDPTVVAARTALKAYNDKYGNILLLPEAKQAKLIPKLNTLEDAVGSAVERAYHSIHKGDVEQAIAEGKPVPQANLDRYGLTAPDVADTPAPRARSRASQRGAVLIPFDIPTVEGVRDWLKKNNIDLTDPELPAAVAAWHDDRVRQALDNGVPVHPDNMPQATPPAEPPKPPTTPQTPAGTPEPNLVGITKDAINAQLSDLGQEALPPREWGAWQTAFDAAKKEGLAAGSEEHVTELAKAGSALDKKDAAGALIRSRELIDAIKAAPTEAERNALQDQYNAFADNLDKVKSKMGDDFNALKMLIADDYSLAAVVHKAGKAWEREPTPAEVEALKAKTDALDAVQAETPAAEAANAALVVENERLKAENERIRNERLSAKAGRKDTIRTVRGARKAAIQETMAQHLARFNELTGRHTAGLDPEAAWELGQYLFGHVRLGAETVGQVYDLAKEDVKGITREDVIRALNRKNPNAPAEIAARTALMQRMGAVHREADLMAQIEDAKNGVFKQAQPRESTTESAHIQALRAELSDLKAKAGADTTRARRVAALETRLRKAVSDLQNGVVKEQSKSVPFDSPTIRTLRGQLKELRAAAAASTKDTRVRAAKLKLIDELQAHLDAGTRPAKKAAGPAPPPDIEAMSQSIKDYRTLMDSEDTIKDLNEQLRTGVYTAAKGKTPGPMDGPLARNQIAIKDLRANIDADIARRQGGIGSKIWRETQGVGRSMNVALHSALFRQDLSLTIRGIVADPGGTIEAHMNAWKGTFNTAKAAEVQNAMEEDPAYTRARKAGMPWLQVHQGEFGDTPLAERLTGGKASPVAATERNYRLLMNGLRLHAFKVYEAAHPEATMDQLKGANHVFSIVSGKGDISGLGKLKGAASQVFFAPAMKASRFQYAWQWLDALRAKDPALFKEVTKIYAGDAAVLASIYALAKMSGAKISTNIYDPRFGKPTWGNTSIDVTGGKISEARRLLMLGDTGLRNSPLGKRLHMAPPQRPLTLSDYIGREGVSGLAPNINLGLTLATGKNMATGQPVSPLEALTRYVAPFGAQAGYDAYHASGPRYAPFAAGATTLGMGAESYAPKMTGRGGRR